MIFINIRNNSCKEGKHKIISGNFQNLVIMPALIRTLSITTVLFGNIVPYPESKCFGSWFIYIFNACKTKER